MEVLSSIIGFVYWKKLKGTFWIIYPFFLLFVFCSELFGYYSISHHLFLLNMYFYQYFFIPFQFIFYYWLFYMNLKSSKFRNFPIISSAFYIICTVIDALAHAHIKHNHFLSTSFVIGSLILFLLIICYFVVLMQSTLIFKYKHNIFFWICLGLLEFYLGSAPFFGLVNIIYYQFGELTIILTNLMYVQSIIMYILFIIGFIWGKPNY